MREEGEVDVPRRSGVASGGDIYDLIHDLDAIIWELDIEAKRFTFVSQRAEVLLGYPISRWLDDPGFWAEVLVHPEDRERVCESTLRARESDSDYRVEYRAVAADGRVLWLRHVSRVVSGSAGGGQRRGIIFDITEQKAAESALRESEGRFRSLVESISDIVAMIGSDYTFQYLSPSVERILGYSPEDTIGRSPVEFVHPDDASFLEWRLASRFRGEVDPEQLTEMRFRHRDGSWRILQVRGRWHQPEQGEPVVILTARDVTERRRSEEELSRQRAYFARLFEGSPEAIVLLDAEDRVQRINEEFTRLFGYSPEEALGAAINDLVVPEHLYDEAISLSRRAVRGERIGVETVRRRRDGSSVHVSILAVPVDFGDGTTHIYGIYRDVTARKRAEEALAASEEQLRQAQKMEAVGRLAGGVAHDFNNLLTAIQGHAQLLLDRLAPDDPRREDAEEVWRSVERAATLTRQLLAFSRKQILKPEAVDLNAIVVGVETMLRRLIGEEIEFEAVLRPGLGRVHADPGQLEQVIMNLVVNARDAMPSGGKLTIETRNVEIEETSPIRFAYPVSPGPYVVLIVEDTGTGMPQEVQERIFEPFFTTKEQGQGTGLGLSTVYGIVQQSGGCIEVESGEGAGTRVLVYLPLVDEAVSPAGGETTANGEDGKSWESREGGGSKGADSVDLRETVLVVEDEEAVRSLICKVLRRQGYEVIDAANGLDALRVLERREGSVDLVVTDVVMPGMSGTELAERVRRTNPALRFLYMSGYTEDELVRRGVADGRVVLLEKPFSPATLTRRIREALSSGREQHHSI